MNKTWMFVLLAIVVVVAIFFVTGGFKQAAVTGVSKCADSDGGIEYNVYGEVTYRNSLYKDSCVMVNSVKEYYCKLYTGTYYPTYVMHKCPNGCEDGVCKPS